MSLFEIFHCVNLCKSTKKNRRLYNFNTSILLELNHDIQICSRHERKSTLIFGVSDKSFISTKSPLSGVYLRLCTLYINEYLIKKIIEAIGMVLDWKIVNHRGPPPEKKNYIIIQTCRFAGKLANFTLEPKSFVYGLFMTNNLKRASKWRKKYPNEER